HLAPPGVAVQVDLVDALIVPVRAEVRAEGTAGRSLAIVAESDVPDPAVQIVINAAIDPRAAGIRKGDGFGRQVDFSHRDAVSSTQDGIVGRVSALSGTQHRVVPSRHARTRENRLVPGVRQQGPETRKAAALAVRPAGLID